jgi:tetratricopeptide (TPR) repeat protein
VERWSDTMLAIPLVLHQTARALPMQLRRLQARVRLGHATQDTEAECRELLAVAERVGSAADLVQTRSLLVQTLARKGDTSEAVRIARESVRIAESHGDDNLSGEAMHRLAITLVGTNPADAVGILHRLIARARTSRDRTMAARAFLTLGVARTFGRDDRGGLEAFRSALRLAREAQALDLAATASMNLGVLEMRSGDFAAAYEACTDALRLYTTLRNNANRLIALYNLANLERERGDAEAARALYVEAAALAEQLGTADVAIGAWAGVGIVSLRLSDREGARTALASAIVQLEGRNDWWFQGRELLESLVVRLAVYDGNITVARERFHRAVAQLEPIDMYAAGWMVADCAAELAPFDEMVWPTVYRLAANEVVRQLAPLAARFTALHDLLERPLPMRGPRLTASRTRVELAR